MQAMLTHKRETVEVPKNFVLLGTKNASLTEQLRQIRDVLDNGHIQIWLITGESEMMKVLEKLWDTPFSRAMLM